MRHRVDEFYCRKWRGGRVIATRFANFPSRQGEWLRESERERGRAGRVRKMKRRVDNKPSTKFLLWNQRREPGNERRANSLTAAWYERNAKYVHDPFDLASDCPPPRKAYWNFPGANRVDVWPGRIRRRVGHSSKRCVECNCRAHEECTNAWQRRCYYRDSRSLSTLDPSFSRFTTRFDQDARHSFARRTCS